MRDKTITAKLILTPDEIESCREVLRDAPIETHIANALCDMALHSLYLHKI